MPAAILCATGPVGPNPTATSMVGESEANVTRMKPDTIKANYSGCLPIQIEKILMKSDKAVPLQINRLALGTDSRDYKLTDMFQQSSKVTAAITALKIASTFTGLSPSTASCRLFQIGSWQY